MFPMQHTVRLILAAPYPAAQLMHLGQPESEGEEARSATEVYTELQATYLKNIPCALLHGRLKNQEKEEIMSLFAAGEIKVLIRRQLLKLVSMFPMPRS